MTDLGLRQLTDYVHCKIECKQLISMNVMALRYKMIEYYPNVFDKNNKT